MINISMQLHLPAGQPPLTVHVKTRTGNCLRVALVEFCVRLQSRERTNHSALMRCRPITMNVTLLGVTSGPIPNNVIFHAGVFNVIYLIYITGKAFIVLRIHIPIY
jgi:hypothetical protein